ncbi:MAG: hypothetical protein IT564_11920, partial [Rhodospirillales bacterium]|nr:hypothetical protein [Rhodospirillales bacterium]
MHIDKAAGQRGGTLLLLLAYLLAFLLPAPAVAAGEQGDQEIVIPKAVVDVMVYQALWQESYQGSDAIEALIYDLVILQAGAAGLSEADLTRVLGELNDKVEKSMRRSAVQAASSQSPTNAAPPSPKAIAHTMMDAALTIPELHPLIGKIWQSFAGPLGLPQGLDQATKVARGAGNLFASPQMQAFMRNTVAQVVATAQVNAAVAGGCDTVHKKKLKVSVKNFDGGKTAKATPTLGIPPEIIQNIQLNGTINVTLNQLKALSQTEFNHIHQSLDDMQQTLVTIDQ